MNEPDNTQHDHATSGPPAGRGVLVVAVVILGVLGLGAFAAVRGFGVGSSSSGHPGPTPHGVRPVFITQAVQSQEVFEAITASNGITVDARHAVRLARFTTAGRSVTLYAAPTNLSGEVCVAEVIEGQGGQDGGCSGRAHDGHPIKWTLEATTVGTLWGGRWSWLAGAMPARRGVRVTATARSGSAIPVHYGNGWFVLAVPGNTPQEMTPAVVTVRDRAGQLVRTLNVAGCFGKLGRCTAAPAG